MVPVDGLSIHERVRSVKAAPIVLLLLRGDDHGLLRGRQVGVTDFLRLPCGIEELHTCIQAALNPIPPPAVV